ncbi:MAG TPA: PQQ-dependent sugar dehydrogenase [Chloroflexia bacterium]|nr:PQQ-dependent sugar dehydrogenase [Chloroflexia bacterium]
MTTHHSTLNLKAFLFLLLFAALALLAVGMLRTSEASETKPAGFPPPPTVTTEPLPAGIEVQTVLAGMVQPVAMAFDPQGRLFYTERSGAVRLFANGALQASPVITFPNIYNGAQCIESRLLGIAVDPQFSANRYVYAYYTEPLECNVAVNRVVRFVENGGVGGSATHVFTSTQTGPLHNGGILNFGPDGKLYITLGDDNNAVTAQDVTVKAGKMHRINPDGTIPPGNPTITQTGALPSIYAIGMRNPFGFAFDTVVSGRIFMSDNGPECDDELNRVEAGYNYGWRGNYPCDDGNPDPTYNTVPPMWYVPQGQNPAAPTGVEVYDGNAIPAWQDHLFMCSFADRKLRHFYLNSNRTQATTVATVQGVECGMDLETGPDGALYYIDAGGYVNGNLKRIAPSPPQAPCGTMVGSIVPSGNISETEFSELYAISALSANDVWTVGSHTDLSNVRRSIVWRWNGSQWSNIPVPNSESVILEDIVAIATNNVWAVGSSGPATLTMRWNGSQWSIVPSPNVGTLRNRLLGVGASGPNDVWAVGVSHRSAGSFTRTDGLTLHWNGAQWSVVPSYSEEGGRNIWLKAVTVIAGNDAWAVGAIDCFATPPTEGNCVDPGYIITLALHWDGAVWSVIPTPNTMAYLALHGVDAVSSNEVWAVGSGSVTPGTPIAMRWNGQTWSAVPLPHVTRYLGLYDIQSAGANNVWAAGYGDQGRALFHWNGQGWDTVSSGGNGTYASLAVISGNNIMAAGHDIGRTTYRARVDRWNGTQLQSIFPDINAVRPLDNTLRGISALAPDDIWAVGWHADGTLIQHWDGTQWTIVPSAYDTNNPNNVLHSVTAIAPDDVWSAGYIMGGPQTRTLTEHWDGAQWQPVVSPNVGSGINQLRSIDASSSLNVWAVGHYVETTTVRPLILRWQGTQWDVVPAPDFGEGTEARLLSVEVISDSDAWAVGNFKATPSGNAETLTLHWNGSAWSRVPSPNADPSTHNFLRGVTAVAPNDVWAAGYYGPAGTGQSLFLHWNGTQWSHVPTPNAGDNTFPIEIKAASANDVWAVGNAFSEGVARSLVMHWDGGAWSVVPSPNASSGNNYLFGIAPVSASDVWMVGEYSNENGRMTLVERYQPQLFTDVPANNTFYPYVQCLACRGVMGGYSDNTFRPNNNITRGQLSKIVANSAGFNEPVSGMMFEDVPTTNTFYEFVQRMASRGIIGGYPCGGANEPCGEGDKPYFRPNANATRGQISKIVSQARGYTNPVSGQRFEDVPASNSFYLYIERLASRGIMGGYPCGTVPTEPCGPQNRPYFRWGANATRGQSSKVVANTFFPNCETANAP